MRSVVILHRRFRSSVFITFKSRFLLIMRKRRGSSVASYGGLREIAKPASLAEHGGFWVKLGEQQIHVSTEAGVDRTATKAHLAYEVADLAAWRVRLAAVGCTILESIPIPGYDRFEPRDPFGNRIELIERT